MNSVKVIRLQLMDKMDSQGNLHLNALQASTLFAFLKTTGELLDQLERINSAPAVSRIEDFEMVDLKKAEG